MQKHRFVGRWLVLCAVSAALLGPELAWADSATWSGGGSTAAWNSVTAVGLNIFYTNWGNITFDPAATTDVTFGGGFASGNPNLNGSRTVHSVTIDSTSTFSIVGNSGNTFTFGGLTRTPSSSGAQTFSVPVLLNGNSTWSIDGSGGLVMASSVGDGIVGSSLTKTGAGQLTLGGGTADTIANTWTGATTISAGTVVLNKAAGTIAIASSNIVIKDGTLQLNNSNQINNSSSLELNSGTFDLNGYVETIGQLTGKGGTIASGAGTGELFVNQSTNTVADCGFSGSGTLAKQGAGLLTIKSAGSNSLGGFETDAGGLSVTGSYDLDGGTTIAVNGGAMTIGDSSTITISGAAGPSTGTAYADSGGTLNISGAHTTVALPFQSLAGIGGNGTFNINAATVNAGTFMGASFANGSTGTININNGAQLTVPNLFAGARTGSSGTINISEPGTLVADTNYVGIGGSDSTAADGGGTGTINVSNSASLTTPYLNFYSNLATLVVDHGSVTAGVIQEFNNSTNTTIKISDGSTSALTLGSDTGKSTYDGIISDYTDGSGSLTKVGINTLTLTNPANSFTGPVYIDNGFVVVSSVALSGTPCPLGAGSEIVFDGGSLECTSQNQSFSDRSVVLGSAGGAIQVDGALSLGSISYNSSTPAGFGKTGVGSLIVTGISAGPLNIYSGSLTDGGALSASSMTISNGATAHLVGSSSVTGLVSVGGTLVLDAALSTDKLTNTGTVKMNDPNGALTIGSGNSSYTFAGSIQGASTTGLTKVGSGTVTLSGANSYSGPTTISAGTLVLDNSLTTPGGAITIAPGATLQASGFLQRQILGTGTLSADGTLFVGSLLSNLGFPGTLNLGGYSVQLLGGNEVSLGTSTVITDGGHLSATGTMMLMDTLTSTGNATITGSFDNFGTVSAGSGASDLLTFTDDAGGPGSFSGNLRFQKGFEPLGLVNAGKITLDPTAVARLQFPTSVSTNSLVNNGQFLQSGGSATISGAISGTGVISISAGTLVASSITQTGLEIEGGTVSLAKHSDGGSTSILQGIQISGTGNLNLADNDLIIDYQGASPIAQIQSYLAAGYDHGAWDGPGIDSSAAQTKMGTALGYGDRADLGLDNFGGVDVDNTAVLIGYTWYGDANLDGVVNSADLAIMTHAGNTWMQGDFNYDGKVDGDDYSLFALGLAASNGANISTILPEPAALSALAIATCLGARRRGRYG